MRICSELVSEKFRATLDAFSLVIRTYTCETLACVETTQHLDIFYFLLFTATLKLFLYFSDRLLRSANTAHR